MTGNLLALMPPCFPMGVTGTRADRGTRAVTRVAVLAAARPCGRTPLPP